MPIAKDGWKVCTACGANLPVSEFTINRRCRDGLHTQCGPCRSRIQQHYGNRHDPRFPGLTINRRRQMWSKYRIRPEHYLAALKAEGGCWICSKPEGKPFSMHIDHCHKTGKIRGLLCGDCNAALGHLHDDPDIAMCLVGYLKQSVGASRV